MRGLPSLTLATLVGCALVAGTFFAFSTFVMRGLSRVPSTHGMGAMQSINVAVLGPFFMTAFMGTALASLALAILSGFRLGQPGMGLLFAGSLLYLIGCFAITAAFNVPLNDALAASKPEGDGLQLWSSYVRTWTLWNHVRTLSATAALVLYALSLIQQGSGFRR